MTAATTPWSWGYWSYSNPYCTAPVVVESAPVDYSQPIVLASPVVDSSATTAAPAEETAADVATGLMDSARDAFGQGDYKTALADVDRAIKQLPNDAVLHEFRGLILFAQGRYKEAAAAIYAVLAVGPGWDWTTLSGLYPDIDVYTEQIRKLETYQKANPRSTEAAFLLGYQYLTCGHIEAAAKQFQLLAKLTPQDRLAVQLAESLAAPQAAEPAAAIEPATPPRPVQAASLAGDWKASRPDGDTIGLTLGKDSKFTWTYAQQGKPQKFSGTYSVADDLLILKQGDTPTMVGSVKSLGVDKFNFKLAGGSPSDPGLTFAK